MQSMERSLETTVLWLESQSSSEKFYERKRELKILNRPADLIFINLIVLSAFATLFSLKPVSLKTCRKVSKENK